MATTSCISGEGYWYPQILWWCSLSDGLRFIQVTMHKCCMGGCNPRGLSFPWMSSIELENWHFFEWRRFCRGICLENGNSFQYDEPLAYTHHLAVFYCEIGVVVKRIVFENFTDQAEQSKHQTSQFVLTFTRRLWINSDWNLILVCNKIRVSKSV